MFNKLFCNRTLNSAVLRKIISPKIVLFYSKLASEPALTSLLTKSIPNSIIYNHLLKNHENRHAHLVMHSLPEYNNTLLKTGLKVYLDIQEQEFENLLNKQWRSETGTEIVKAFVKACSFSKQNNISLSDTRFDKLVDGLVDRCQDLTDDELSELLVCIREYPVPESITSHNFHDIWSALDDMCAYRHQKWPTEKLLLFADHWYLLGLSRYSDFVKDCIKRLARKVNHLNRAELVQSFFLINTCRKPWDMFEFECQLEKHIDKLTIDELGIVSMSFFKTQKPIKGTFLLSQILTKLLDEIKTVPEITLTAILKIVRYSPHLPLIDLIAQLLVKLESEIDRVSLLCCVHIALLGTNAQFCNKEILTRISEKFLANMSEARLKDLERLTFALTLYNFNPPTSKSMFQEILKELYKPERENEYQKHPRCLSSSLYYLSLQQMYPYDLINRVLDKEFLKFAYGPNLAKIGREILFLDNSLTLDCPDYSGNRISQKLKNRLSKWSLDWIPDKEKRPKMSAADKLLVNITETLETIAGGKEYININYILPHFQRPDVLFCKDTQGNPVKISHIQKSSLEEIMYPKDDNKWFAVIGAGWNSYIKGTTNPTGILATKMRQLQKIGYTPIMVPWHEFAHITNAERVEYINNKIR